MMTNRTRLDPVSWAAAKTNAIKLIADSARQYWTASLFGLIFTVFALAGCSALPDKPQRAVMYDFGPGALTAGDTSTRQASLPPLAIDDIGTPGGVLDNQAVLYRLAYVDSQQLRPYSQARWTMPPAQLIRQRLRNKLSERRAVFNVGESAAMNRAHNATLPRLLRLDLEEFSHLFTAPAASVGLVRMRATLVELTPAGEKLVAQRSVLVQRPAPTPDAPGGVRALTQAIDAAIEEIDQWVQQAAAS
jgi:cholesterol transport system auxiliary component